MIIKEVDSEALLFKLKQEGIALSSGAACSTNKIEPSHVLQAIGVSDDDIYSALRFGLGRNNTIEDVTTVVDLIRHVTSNLKMIPKI